jgi:Fur family transcriptional regulator, peroxide stress response regulator
MATMIREPKEVAAYLKEHAIKPSVIRIKVMQLLMDTKEHPTADAIYRKLIRDIPTLSKTSIYNTLKLFSKKNVVKEIKIEDNEIRYDGDMARHAHFKCVKCSSMQDLKVQCDFKMCSEIKNAKVIEAHVNIMGICADCLAKGVK